MRHITYNSANHDVSDEAYSYLDPALRPAVTNPGPSQPPAQMSEEPQPVYDPALRIVWMPFRVEEDVNPPEIAFEDVPQGPMFHDQNQPVGHGSNVEAANSRGVNIDPSSQLQTRHKYNTRNATSSRITTPSPSPLKRKSASSADDESSSKRQPPNEQSLQHIPGLCKQTSANKVWKCLFRDPRCRASRASGCGAVLNGARNLRRHIGVHAKLEQYLIEEGDLSPGEAIAIPNQVLMEYECEVPDCGYLKENGEPYRYVAYRVDAQKARHIREYHS